MMLGPRAQITVLEQFFDRTVGVLRVGRVGSGEAAC
jgi:hypothetical protein